MVVVTRLVVVIVSGVRVSPAGPVGPAGPAGPGIVDAAAGRPGAPGRPGSPLTPGSPVTLAVIEFKLGWAPGSCVEIVHGSQPVSEADPVFARAEAAWLHLSDDARLMLAELAERSTT